MSAAGDLSLTMNYDVTEGMPVLTLGGVLTIAAGAILHDAVMRVRQQDQTTLLIDVSAVAVGDRTAVAVFADAVAEALQWPDVLVLICGPSAVLRDLRDADVVDSRLLFGSLADGRTAGRAAVAPVSEDLLPLTGAARWARNVVTEACLRWDEPGLVGQAALVASELVTNATVHANTMMTMQVRLRPWHLYVAVFDGSTTPAVLRDPRPDNDGGRGLQLVNAVSAAWGSTALQGGKVVWAALARPRNP